MIAVTDVRAEAILDCVPESVKCMAAAIEIGKDIGLLLMTDKRMDSVWRELQKQAKANGVEIAMRALNSRYRMQKWGVSELGISLPDRACAAFYSWVVIELGVPKESATRQGIAAMAKPWHSAAERCRMAIHSPGRPGLEPELARALEMSSQYLEEYSQFIIESAGRDGPYILKRSSGQRNDNSTRGKVRALAMGTKAMFGSYLYRTVSTVASVALQTDVDWESVRNWCQDLPCQ